jgi:hypothetical protein
MPATNPSVQFKLSVSQHDRLMARAQAGESPGLVAKRLLLAALETLDATQTPAMVLAERRAQAQPLKSAAARKMAARKEPEVVGPRIDPDETPNIGSRPK